MRYELLGLSGLRVSKICLGTAWFGLGPTVEEAPRVVNRALDLGINFFDCANTYGNRASFDREGIAPASERPSAEEMLGAALKGRRQDVIITSKVQEKTGEGPNEGGPGGGGLTRRHIMQQVERSLRRLQTDYIDVYYAHHPDPTTPLDQTLRAFEDLVRQGKVRYFALSTFPAWQIMHALWLCDSLGLNTPVCLQQRYNLADRFVETEIVPACLKFGLSMTAFSPLGGGLLTGPATRSRVYTGRARMSMPGPPFSEDEVKTAEALDELSSQWELDPASVGLAWLLARPALTSAIVGPETVEELETAVAAESVQLSPDQVAALDALAPPARVRF